MNTDEQSIPDHSGCLSINALENWPGVDCAESVSDTHEPRSGLDLIFGHLRTTTNQYQPVHRNNPDNEWPEGWYRPSGDWSASDENNLVLKIQPFRAGGYEATVRPVCLPELARMFDAPRARGERVAPDEVDRDSQLRSIQRSKTMARLKIKSMGADRLLTLTKREVEQTGYWSLNDWADAWKRFCRLCKSAGHEFEYLAIPERHKKGNYHLHVALNARCNIKLMRSIWWVCCGGRGLGNVDISYKQHLTRTARLSGISRYLTKYLVKQMGLTEFNRKRYWSSRHELPPAVRVVLMAGTLEDALREISDLLRLDLFRVLATRNVLYTFPSGTPTGLWLNWCPEIQGDPF